MARQEEPSIRFAGPPTNLAAHVELPRDPSVQPLLLIDRQSQPLRVGGDDGTITELALSMPADTPPGKITAWVVVGDKKYQAIIDVQPRRVIRIEPSTLDFKCAAGDTMAATVNITNLGNSVLNYEADQTITLRKSGTLARSVVTAFKHSKLDFLDRLVELGEEIASTGSHQLAVSCHMKTKTIKTGECATVELELGVPQDLEPDTRWSGSLALLGARVRINVETSASRGIRPITEGL